MKWKALCLLISILIIGCHPLPHHPPAPVVPVVSNIMEVHGVVMTQDHASVPHLKCLLVVDDVPEAYRCLYDGIEVFFYVPAEFDGVRGAYLLLSADHYQSVEYRIGNLHPILPRQLLVPTIYAQ